MTNTMRAAFLDAARSISIREVPIPHPDVDEVLLRIRYCGICGSDLTVFKTGALAGPNAVLGHEIVATVQEDGSGDLEPGTRVIVFPPRGCGECMWCREGRTRYCVNPPRDAWGGYAQFASYPARNLIPLPDDVQDRAASLADPLGVALRAVDRAAPAAGELAYVNGLGPIGLLTTSALAAAGVRVLCGDPVAQRRDLALVLGADQVIDPTQVDPYETSLDIDPRGPHYAFECSGTVEGLQQIFDACGHRGTVGILGVPMGPVLLLRMTTREQYAFSIAGPTRESMIAALDHLRRNPVAARVVSGETSLGLLQSTMEGLVAHTAGVKVLLDPWA